MVRASLSTTGWETKSGETASTGTQAPIRAQAFPRRRTPSTTRATARSRTTTATATERAERTFCRTIR
jgi:hypothetical protein